MRFPEGTEIGGQESHSAQAHEHTGATRDDIGWQHITDDVAHDDGDEHAQTDDARMLAAILAVSAHDVGTQCRTHGETAN